MSPSTAALSDAPSFILRDGFSHKHLSECGSTNAALLDQPLGNDRVWLTAGRQTSGRGRGGRAWVSEEGNLFASVRLENPSSLDKAAGLSFVLALAARDAVVASGAIPELRLKWPNDMLVGGAKIAGLLLEANTLPTGQFAVVCGVGINCAHAPDREGTLYETTSLADLGFSLEPQDLFAHLWQAFVSRLELWDQGHGMAAICAEWKRHAAGLGQTITARTGNGERRGIFRDLTPDGHLIIDTAQGRETITAADIFLG